MASTNLKITVKEDSDKLVITIPRRSDKGTISGTGKSFIVASTGGFLKLDDFGMPGFMLNLVMLRSKPKGKDKDDAPVKRKKKKEAD